MARTRSIQDADIMKAARSLLLERGIGVTTAEVALRAGISEGSIFNRWHSKQDLFRAALGNEAGDPRWLRRLEAHAGKKALEPMLVEAAHGLVEFYQRILPLQMLVWSQAPHGKPDPVRSETPPALVTLRRLSRVFEAEMRGGRLRRGDAEILARMFLGAIHGFVFFEVLLASSPDELPLPASTFIRGFLHLLLAGARPPVAAAPVRKRSHK